MNIIKKTWNICQYKTEDEKGIIKLLNEELDERFNLEYWKWKYKENPAGFFSNIWLAKSNEKIVGHYAIIPVKIKVQNRTILGAQSVDTITHKDYRRQGIFTTLAKKTLTEAANDGIQITSGIPGVFSYDGFINKLGWKKICYIPEMYKVLNIREAFNLKLYINFIKNVSLNRIYKCIKTFKMFWRKEPLSNRQLFYLHSIRETIFLFISMLFNLLTIFKSPFKSPPSNIKSLKIKKVKFFDDETDKFCTEVSKSYDIMIERNKEYLNWRYVNNPVDKYVIFLAKMKNRILGYIVLRATKKHEDIKTGKIMEILTLPNRDDVFICLINKAVEYFKKNKKSIIYCWMSKNHSHYKTLKKLGFFDQQIPITLFSHIKSLRRTICTLILYVNTPQNYTKIFFDEKKWFLALGDSDLA